MVFNNYRPNRFSLWFDPRCMSPFGWLHAGSVGDLAKVAVMMFAVPVLPRVHVATVGAACLLVGALSFGGSGDALAQATAPAPTPAAKTAAKSGARTAAVAQKSASAVTGTGSGSAIVLLVNDEPVTAYEVDQRARLAALSSDIGNKARDAFQALIKQESTSARLKAIFEDTIKQNQGKSRDQVIAIFEQRKTQFAMSLQKQAMDSARASVIPKHRTDALEEIIEEKLKLQEAKKQGIDVTEEMALATIKGIAERNKQTPDQFAQNLKNAGVDIGTMKARFMANFAWRDVIRRKFSHLININQKEVEKLAAATADGSEDAVELQIQKISLPLPPSVEQGAMTKRLAEADSARRKYAGCASVSGLAKDLPGAKFEEAKYVKPSTISEPTRSMLLAAKDGEMVPPQISGGGVDLYAVCARRTGKLDEKKREAAQLEIQSREFELMAKRHLRDLRQDAHIEKRT
jgi:peptidyl-prolyl cis-trans isomerase SurA